MANAYNAYCRAMTRRGGQPLPPCRLLELAQRAQMMPEAYVARLTKILERKRR